VHPDRGSVSSKRPRGAGALIRCDSRRRPTHPPPTAEAALDRRLLTVTGARPPHPPVALSLRVGAVRRRARRSRLLPAAPPLGFRPAARTSCGPLPSRSRDSPPPLPTPPATLAAGCLSQGGVATPAGGGGSNRHNYGPEREEIPFRPLLRHGA